VRLVDPPSPIVAPERYPGLMLLAVTVWLEAEGEPAPGRLGVAYVICNRALLRNLDLHKVILGPDGVAYDDDRPWEQFSCWNDDYRGQARSRIAKLTENQKGWESIYGIAAGAWWRMLPDPTHGAEFYLNPMLTKQIRPNHDLPGWWDSDTDPASEVVLGSHAFRKRA